MNSPTPWRVALDLRVRVLRRRFVSPLELVALLVVTGLAWLVGGKLGERLVKDEVDLAAGATLALVVLLLVGGRIATRLLYGSRELVLLLSHGLPPRSLARLRALELTVLHAVLLLPLLACFAGVQDSWSQEGASIFWAVALAFAPALAAGSLLVGWVVGRLDGRVIRVLVVLGGAGLIAGLSIPPARAVIGHTMTPGGSLQLVFDGHWWPLAAALGVGALGLVVVEQVVPRGFSRGLDRAAQRYRSGSHRTWRLTGVLLRPLGRQAAALLQRDLALLIRGGFLRGAAILTICPLALGILHLVQTDPQLKPWHLQLVALFLIGVLASAAGFLFGVDFPRARRRCLILERTQPLRGRDVLVSRWAPAACYTLVLVAVATWMVHSSERPEIAARAGAFLPGGVLLAFIVTHHAVTYGMRSETSLDPAESAAYPLNGGVVVILFALALLISPLTAVGYPLLWFGFTTGAIRRWETAEVEAMHEAAA